MTDEADSGTPEEPEVEAHGGPTAPKAEMIARSGAGPCDVYQPDWF